MVSTDSPCLWNRSFILCVLNNLFIFSYYFAFLTILPVYILKELGGTIGQAGLALTLFLISSIAIRPFTGLIIEKIGKKRAFRGAEFLFVFFAFAYLFADSLWMLFLVRFIHGFWFSILTTVTVPIANDFIPEQRKGEGMGYFVMSTHLGVVIGPFLALTIVQYSNFMTLFAVLTGIICLGFILCLLIPVQQNEQRIYVAKPAQVQKIQFSDIIETRAIPIGLVALSTAFAYSSVMSFIAAYAEETYLVAYVSWFFIIFAMSMIVIRPWIGKCYDRKGASAVIYPAFLSFSLGLVLIAFATEVWLLWLSAVFIGMGYGSLFPCFQTLALQSVEKPRMGHAISTFFTLFDLGLAVGSVVMGLIIAQIGFSYTYLACAVVVILTLVLYQKIVATRLQPV